MRQSALKILCNPRTRHIAVVAIDTLCAIVALALAVWLRMNGNVPPEMASGVLWSLPILVGVSMVSFQAAGLYRRTWRYVSTKDLPIIVAAAAASILISTLIVVVSGHGHHLPTSVPVIQWFILVAGLSGVRIARRVELEHRRAKRWRRPSVNDNMPPRRRAIVIGTGDDLDLALRQIESDTTHAFEPVGILDDVSGHLKLRVRGVPVLGSLDALEHAVQQLDAEGRRPACLILAASSERPANQTMMRLVTDAENLGLGVAHLSPRGTSERVASGELNLDFIDMAALLGRTPVSVDIEPIMRFVAHQRVLVTGAGGTIGRELVRQIAAAGPGELILIDACEFNLYSVDQELGENFPHIPRAAVMCSIRQRGAVMAAFAKYRPNLVFHAAALKHVPLVEANPCAGVQTNVLGTRNVADASRKFGVRAMVQVSTDKAVNPVGVMGATKRLGELYCQALDLDGDSCPVAPRFLTVRFGNVLGSSGSLIPLFQRQLSRRVPLSVTHPDIRRYFMTVHEAVQLILQGAAQALTSEARRGRIFVLDMGEPIRVMDIARRMIRLAGLEPDRDVKIDIIGLRPGEKLFEELFDTSERRMPSVIPGILEAEPVAMSLTQLNQAFDQLSKLAAADDTIATRALLAEILQPATNTCVGYGRANRMPVMPALQQASPQPVMSPAMVPQTASAGQQVAA